MNKSNQRRFDRQNGRLYVDRLAKQLADYFTECGYTEHESVNLTSGLDPSVRFIGSNISVFKQYIISNSLPMTGYFSVQPCLRTQNLSGIVDSEYLSNWASYFKGFGSLVFYKDLERLVHDTLYFFTSVLSLSSNDFSLRASSTNTDLLEAIDHTKLLLREQIELDTMPPSYYQHKIGIDDLEGRNFNIAIRNMHSKKLHDVGNVIVLSKTDGTAYVELALGITMLLSQLEGLDHVLDCFPLIGLDHLETLKRRKLEDAIVASTALVREGLAPDSSSSRGRSLRDYIRAINFFVDKCGISDKKLFEILRAYEQRQYDDVKVAYLIEDYLHKYNKQRPDITR